ncbi:hypothetical protein [Halobacillus amylolyticus]|uniref:HNH endonuclease n=1 Tax=Halobacillus amylolyticus TaxID=2932259 RepID=A0ABY4HHI5_9BACI|nr:hypothetical protein [Halobacillus amylolyticus]UOR14089.1 hypothetical protein MUO15_21270 [Halobacillus amylolyticus]
MISTDIKAQYEKDYEAFKKEWSEEDEELMCAGQLSYWVYWLSQSAEEERDFDKKNKLFTLKHNCMVLLKKSRYTQLRKYQPKKEVNTKLCDGHRKIIKDEGHNIHWYLHNRKEEILTCPNCQKMNKGKYSNYYSLFSLAILNGDSKILYIFYAPYPVMKKSFPPLRNLRSVKRYRGNEFGRIRINSQDNKKLENIFSVEDIIQEVTKSYDQLAKHLHTE